MYAVRVQDGDVYVLVNVLEDPRFVREGNDIYSQVDLTIVQAALGLTVTVETLDGPVDVVGHSAGAFCSAALASAHPERVQRLALVAPAGVGDPSKLTALPFGPTDRRFWQFYAHAIPVYLGRGNAHQHKAVYDLLVPALHVDPAKCPQFVADPRGKDAPAPARAAMLRGIPDLTREALAGIEAPTLIVAGSLDPLVPLALAENVAAWIPRADLVVFEGCGHYPQHEAPERLNDVLMGFLN